MRRLAGQQGDGDEADVHTQKGQSEGKERATGVVSAVSALAKGMRIALRIFHNRRPSTGGMHWAFRALSLLVLIIVVPHPSGATATVSGWTVDPLTMDPLAYVGPPDLCFAGGAVCPGAEDAPIRGITGAVRAGTADVFVLSTLMGNFAVLVNGTEISVEVPAAASRLEVVTSAVSDAASGAVAFTSAPGTRLYRTDRAGAVLVDGTRVLTLAPSADTGLGLLVLSDPGTGALVVVDDGPTVVAIEGGGAALGNNTVYLADLGNVLTLAMCDPGFGGIWCDPCPAGTYKAEPGVALCTPCPAGTYAPFAGVASPDQCLDCDDPTFCPAGSTVGSWDAPRRFEETAVPDVADSPAVQPEQAALLAIVPYMGLLVGVGAFLVGVMALYVVDRRPSRLMRVLSRLDFVGKVPSPYGAAMGLPALAAVALCVGFAFSYVMAGQNHHTSVELALVTPNGPDVFFVAPTLEDVAVHASGQWVVVRVAASTGGWAGSTGTYGVPLLTPGVDGRGAVIEIPWVPRAFFNCTVSVVGRVFSLGRMTEQECTQDPLLTQARFMGPVVSAGADRGAPLDVKLVGSGVGDMYERVQFNVQDAGWWLAAIIIFALTTLLGINQWLARKVFVPLATLWGERFRKRHTNNSGSKSTMHS